ncbi:anthranilate phosphoribosyltransferase [Thermodesulfobacteriota bacterium]
MIKEAIAKLIMGQDLSEENSESAMSEILDGQATVAQTASFTTALRIKGETVDEITGCAKAMRSRIPRIHLGNHMINIDRDEINIEDETIIDTCGTGGDETNTFNVSTVTALVVAGGRIKVAKHGQRAESNYCGSANVLEALGLKLDISRTDIERCISEVGIGFLYAPLFYGAIKYPIGPRREMGFRSIFNLLGPLTNPAGTTAQILGVYHPDLTEKMAKVLDRLETREAFVVCGEGTFDEISICGSTRVSHLKNGEIDTFNIKPEDFGIKSANPEDIRGGSAEKNARIIREILNCEKGPKRDMVLLNAGVAFVAAGLDNKFEEGIERAKDSIDSGRAKEKLEALVSFTQKCGFIYRE